MASTAAIVFPDDILREILLRLPARSVCRFRAVCKPWHALATEPAFLRAHARRAASSPVALICTVKERRTNNGIATDLHLSVSHDPAAAAVDNNNRELVVSLPGRCWHPIEIRSWDGIVCVELDSVIGPPLNSFPHQYALLNPISRDCTVVTAPLPRFPDRKVPGVVSVGWGYIAGAYSHPVTGAFHLLHCSPYQDSAYKHAACFQLLRVDGSPASAWREIPASTDVRTATLQSVVGGSWCVSTATVRGILHWRPTLGEQKELLVYDTAKEKFGCMPLPELVGTRSKDVVRSISTLSGKLCLLAEVASNTIEVWVLEGYDSQDWRLRQRIDVALNPLFLIHQRVKMRSVEAIGGVNGRRDQVEEVIFHGQLDHVYNVQSRSWLWLQGPNKCATLHRESLVPHDVIFGAAPRARDVAFSTCPDNGVPN